MSVRDGTGHWKRRIFEKNDPAVQSTSSFCPLTLNLSSVSDCRRPVAGSRVPASDASQCASRVARARRRRVRARPRRPRRCPTSASDSASVSVAAPSASASAPSAPSARSVSASLSLNHFPLTLARRCRLQGGALRQRLLVRVRRPRAARRCARPPRRLQRVVSQYAVAAHSLLSSPLSPPCSPPGSLQRVSGTSRGRAAPCSTLATPPGRSSVTKCASTPTSLPLCVASALCSLLCSALRVPACLPA